jgi:hypothetical protein
MDRAHLEERTYDPPASRRWCLFPCQNPRWRKADGTWDERRSVCRVPIRPQTLPNGHSWEWVAGTPAEAPTLQPSINCMQDTCWHGYIVDGEVRNPATAGKGD